MVNTRRKIDPLESKDGGVPIPRGQRRAVSKARRIEALLDGAHDLIQETAGTDFTMRDLAGRAGLSLATTYNLIGTKAVVLYALLDRSLDELDTVRDGSQSHVLRDRVTSMVELAVDVFNRKPLFYRPLMRYLLGAYEPVLRPRFMNRALAFWRSAAHVSEVPEEGEGTVDRDRLAWHLHLAFTGILDLWVHEELTDIAFKTAMLNHADLLLEALAPTIR